MSRFGQSTHWRPLHGAGYYGPRGGRVVLEHIIFHFAHRLHRAAEDDSLVASCGVLKYAEEVLAPELLASLVMEDLGIDEQTA
ncbi:hypothetical protein ACJ73_04423 [Blastomyces percursus]|uniref:Restriction of telomere capping protein 4 n=1 Tax=Blastomyces percursus TaxID=1658174 RepID=A0A1J9R6T6_9EURO|nr:hypothetical protein ACJ73_04423 [Blastomyces percursus]